MSCGARKIYRRRFMTRANSIGDGRKHSGIARDFFRAFLIRSCCRVIWCRTSTRRRIGTLLNRCFGSGRSALQIRLPASMNELIVIRADGNSSIGNGHVMRCLALAQAWRRAGGRAIFVQASTTATITGRLESEGFETSSIDAEPGGADDARQTIVEAQARHASWIVADGYRFDAEWQQQIKSANLKLLIWDDYGHASAYPADVVLNQNA